MEDGSGVESGGPRFRDYALASVGVELVEGENAGMVDDGVERLVTVGSVFVVVVMGVIMRVVVVVTAGTGVLRRAGVGVGVRVGHELMGPKNIKGFCDRSDDYL